MRASGSSRFFGLSFAVLVFVGVLTMLFSPFSSARAEVGATVRVISAQTLSEQLQSPTPPFLLDVREPQETAVSTIKGAKIIPLGDLPARVQELPRDRVIAVYCRSGARSFRAGQFLLAQGFASVESLEGGINGWAKTIEPGMKTF